MDTVGVIQANCEIGIVPLMGITSNGLKFAITLDRIFFARVLGNSYPFLLTLATLN